MAHKFLQAKVSYIDENTGDNETVSLICNGFSFADSEDIINKYLTDFEDILRFDINGMSRVKFDEFIDSQRPGEDLDLFNFFNVKFSTTSEENGKELKNSFLIRCKSAELAIKVVAEFMEEEEVPFEIKKISKLDYKELVIGKHCDILGLIVVAYSDQREIEITNERILQMDIEKAELKLELGADEVFANKFKVNFKSGNKRGIEKLKSFKGRRIARRVLKTWNETFVDEDTAEVIAIERNEVLVSSNTYLDEEVIDELSPLIGNGIDHLVFYI